MVKRRDVDAVEEKRAVTLFLKENLQIHPALITDEFVRLPGAMAYVNAQYADAVKAHSLAKFEREQVEARLFCDPAFAKELSASLDKARVSVEALKFAILSDPSFVEAKRKEIEAEAHKVRMRGAADAIIAKRDMLISLGAHLRAEMEHDAQINEQSEPEV